jgi:hypothetical protein
LKSFLNRLRIAFLFASAYEQYVARIGELKWTDADQINAARFFSQGTGKKLLLRLETGTVNMAMDAAQKGSIHACGIANGAMMQLQAIRSHSEFPLGTANSATNEDSDAQAGLDALESVTA